MILISHRGNLKGKDLENENNPTYIDLALKKGYDVEVDIRYVEGGFYLGHDKPQYKIEYEWLEDRKDHLWIHCKNHISIQNLISSGLNYFWHDEDDMALTSHGIIWVHPKVKPLNNSVAVMPEVNNWDISECLGVCSDHVSNYN